MHRAILAMAAAGMILWSVVPGWCQDEPDYTFGVVSTVGADQIVISEYDLQSETETLQTYAVNGQTVLDGYDALGDIQPNDLVEIEYTLQDGVKVAKLITASPPEEEQPEDTNSAADLPASPY